MFNNRGSYANKKHFAFRSQAAKPMQTALPTLAKRCPELLSMLLAPKPIYWQLMTFPLTQLMMKTALQKISKDLFQRSSYTGKDSEQHSIYQTRYPQSSSADHIKQMLCDVLVFSSTEKKSARSWVL